MKSIENRKKGFYEIYVKRFFDVVISLISIIVLSPIYLIIALMVRIKLGSPIIFSQYRPSILGEDGKEKIFKLYKFRTMTDERDDKGKLLSDDVRLTKFGKWLRSTSLDELPELFNILNGTMSLIGPRPQLVKDMVFMKDTERIRHTAKAGLTGLAQVNGRNSISWEEKFAWDLEYIKKISFVEDLKIIFKTIQTAIIKKEGISAENMSTAEDLGDYLLRTNKISKNEYEMKLDEYELIMKNIIGK